MRRLIIGVAIVGFSFIALADAVSVTVPANVDATLDEAIAAGYMSGAADYAGLDGILGDFDFIVNTVPARVLTEGMLCLIRPDALLLELASPPGGFDRRLAQNIGLHALAAPGLPGETAPETAALLLRRAVYAAIEEQED